MVKKAVYKGFTLAQDYLRYINDIVFGTKLRDDDLHKKVLTERIRKICIGLPWQPVVSREVKDKIIKEADMAKNHRFDLLGSGEIKVDYKLNTKGLEGYRYDMKLFEKEYLSIKEKVQSELEKVFQRFIEYEPIEMILLLKLINGRLLENVIF